MSGLKEDFGMLLQFPTFFFKMISAISAKTGELVEMIFAFCIPHNTGGRFIAVIQPLRMTKFVQAEFDSLLICFLLVQSECGDNDRGYGQ